MIKQDALFPDSIREIDEDLIVNAIARRNPKMQLTYRGLSFEDSFKRSVVLWIRASYSEAKNFWKKVRGRDWVSSINKNGYQPEGVTSKLKACSNKLSTPLTYTKISAY